MSILVDKNTITICQGSRGSQGTVPHQAGAQLRHQGRRRRDARQGRREHADPELAACPLFDTVAEAEKATGRERDGRSMCRRHSQPTPSSKPSMPRCRSSCASPKAFPVLDMVKVKRALRGSDVAPHRAQLPGRADAEGMQDRHHARQYLPARGRSASSSRSGTLTYEAVKQTTDARSRPVDRGRHRRRSGQRHRASSTCSSCCSPIGRQSRIIMIGEIGGSAEEEAAEFLDREAKKGRKKPMVGLHRRHARRRRDGAWAMRARSSRAVRAVRRTRSKPCAAPASPSQTARLPGDDAK